MTFLQEGEVYGQGRFSLRRCAGQGTPLSPGLCYLHLHSGLLNDPRLLVSETMSVDVVILMSM